MTNPVAVDFLKSLTYKFGLDPKQQIDMNDPMTRLVMAISIATTEQGENIYSYDQYIKGCAESAGIDPAVFDSEVNPTSLGIENNNPSTGTNASSAGGSAGGSSGNTSGYVSPKLPKIVAGGSSLPTTLISQYAATGTAAILATPAFQNVFGGIPLNTISFKDGGLVVNNNVAASVTNAQGMITSTVARVTGTATNLVNEISSNFVASSTPAGGAAGNPVVAVVNGNIPGQTTVQYYDGTVAQLNGTAGWRTNNPGNIIESAFARNQPGYIGSTVVSGNIQAVFATPADGIAAQQRLLFNPNGSYYNGSIMDMVERYAPRSNGGNPDAYAAAIQQQTGLTPGTKLSSLSAEQQKSLTAAMFKVEDSTAGRVNVLTQGSGSRLETNSTAITNSDNLGLPVGETYSRTEFTPATTTDEAYTTYTDSKGNEFYRYNDGSVYKSTASDLKLMGENAPAALVQNPTGIPASYTRQTLNSDGSYTYTDPNTNKSFTQSADLKTIKDFNGDTLNPGLYKMDPETGIMTRVGATANEPTIITAESAIGNPAQQAVENGGIRNGAGYGDMYTGTGTFGIGGASMMSENSSGIVVPANTGAPAAWSNGALTPQDNIANQVNAQNELYTNNQNQLDSLQNTRSQLEANITNASDPDLIAGWQTDLNTTNASISDLQRQNSTLEGLMNNSTEQYDSMTPYNPPDTMPDNAYSTFNTPASMFNTPLSPATTGFSTDTAAPTPDQGVVNSSNITPGSQAQTNAANAAAGGMGAPGC